LFLVQWSSIYKLIYYIAENRKKYKLIFLILSLENCKKISTMQNELSAFQLGLLAQKWSDAFDGKCSAGVRMIIRASGTVGGSAACYVTESVTLCTANCYIPTNSTVSNYVTKSVTNHFPTNYQTLFFLSVSHN
jgi:hypothetical protein